jgi:hypothetical protein
MPSQIRRAQGAATVGSAWCVRAKATKWGANSGVKRRRMVSVARHDEMEVATRIDRWLSTGILSMDARTAAPLGHVCAVLRVAGSAASVSACGRAGQPGTGIPPANSGSPGIDVVRVRARLWS